MNKAQIEAIRRAMEIINLYRGASNKASGMIADIEKYDVTARPGVLTKAGQILASVDGAGANAIEYLTAALNDNGYPAEPK